MFLVFEDELFTIGNFRRRKFRVQVGGFHNQPHRSVILIEILCLYGYRDVIDWVSLGVIDDTLHPLPAMVFVKAFPSKGKSNDKLHSNSLDDLFVWCSAAVIDYNAKSNRWTVITLDGYKRVLTLPRIYICFFAEDSKVFAQRIASAVKSRNVAENLIR